MSSSADWFSRKMGGQSQPRPPQTQSVPYTPPSTWEAQTSTPRVAPASTPSKARSAQEENFCPECQSGNYMKAQGTNILRCFDCGYPIVQTTSGISGMKTEGPTRPARQPTGTANNFNPGMIVGRIE